MNRLNNLPDIEPVLRAYLADTGDRAPDRVLEDLAARIARQPRRPWPFHRRTKVTTPIKLIAGLAAALVVAVVGYNLLPGTAGPGAPTAAPTIAPTAQPTTAPTAAPTVSARWPTWFTPAAIADANGAGILTAGSHATRTFSPGFTFTVPDGWVNSHDEPNFFKLFPDTPANAAQFARADGELAQNIFMGPHSSPWFSCDALETNGGATAAAMVAAMTANEVLAVSGVVDVTIGGVSGKQFDVRRNPDWTGTCPGDSSLPAGVDPDDELTRGFLLDVPGRGVYVIFLYSMSSAEMETFLAEAMPIVQSFEFRLG